MRLRVEVDGQVLAKHEGEVDDVYALAHADTRAHTGHLVRVFNDETGELEFENPVGV